MGGGIETKARGPTRAMNPRMKRPRDSTGRLVAAENNGLLKQSLAHEPIFFLDDLPFLAITV